MTDDATTQRGLEAKDLPPTAVGELTTSARRDGDTCTLRLAGELDMATADDVRGELERLEATDARRIILDLSELTFMDSTGIQLILRARARAQRDARDLALRRGPAAVQRVFALCGVDDLLSFVD